jgi:hypothetical protein
VGMILADKNLQSLRGIQPVTMAEATMKSQSDVTGPTISSVVDYSKLVPWPLDCNGEKQQGAYSGLTSDKCR